MVPVLLSSSLNDAVKTEWNWLIVDPLLVAEWTWNSEPLLAGHSKRQSPAQDRNTQRGFMMFNCFYLINRLEVTGSSKPKNANSEYSSPVENK